MKQLSQILENKIYTKDTREKRLGHAPADPADQIKLGSKTEVELDPVITGKAPFSQGTLQAKSQPYDNAPSQKEIDTLISHYSGLNAEKRRDFIEWLQNGAGVPDNYAAKNRKGYHKEQVEELFDGELYEVQDNDLVLSPEFKAKATALFEQRVAEAVQSDSFRQKLKTLLETYSPSPFMDSEKIDAAEMLALEVNRLENAIYEVEQEKRQLMLDVLAEEELYSQTETTRTPKRSTIDEWMNDPTNEENFFTEEKHNHSGVRRYLNNGRLWGVPDLGN